LKHPEEPCRCGSVDCHVLCPLRKRAGAWVAGCKVSLSKRKWAWTWPLPVWEVWSRYRLPLVSCHELPVWADDWGHLTIKRDVVVKCAVPPPPLLSLCLPSPTWQSISPALPFFRRRVRDVPAPLAGDLVEGGVSLVKTCGELGRGQGGLGKGLCYLPYRARVA